MIDSVVKRIRKCIPSHVLRGKSIVKSCGGGKMTFSLPPPPSPPGRRHPSLSPCPSLPPSSLYPSPSLPPCCWVILVMVDLEIVGGWGDGLDRGLFPSACPPCNINQPETRPSFLLRPFVPSLQCLFFCLHTFSSHSPSLVAHCSIQ